MSNRSDQSTNRRRLARRALRPLMFWVVLVAMLAAGCGSSEDSSAELTSSDSEQGAQAPEMPAATTIMADQPEVDDALGETEAVAQDEAAEEPSSVDANAPLAEPDAGSNTGDGDTGADTGGDASAAADVDADEAESSLGAGGAAVTPTAADLGRKLIFRANLNVGVDDVAAASADATSIIEEMGGFLFAQNTTGGVEPSSELVFKVLPDDFNPALERLGTVGELRNQSVSTNDVTERVVDLESRIEVAELGVERLRAALEETSTLEDFAEVERLLLERESQLEVMRGQLRTLQDQVDLATITLLVTQDRVENAIDLTISTYEGHDLGEACPARDQVTIEAGTEVTVCFDIVNIGDQTLTDITLTDTVLDITDDTELIPVFGTLDELAPGQSASVAFEVVPERNLTLRTRVVAVPTDGVSSEQAGPSVDTLINYDLRTFESEQDPGFGDGFSVAIELLKGLWVLLTVVVGFILPMLILLPFLWLAWRAFAEYRRRRPARPKANNNPPVAYQPPPPPQPVGVAAEGSNPQPPGPTGDDPETGTG